MIIKKLKLNNFGVHRDLELEFNSGMTGIVGRNGAGKSTIFAAIEFLLVGDLPKECTKETMITVGCAVGYVRGWLDVGGKECVITRHLDSPKVEMSYDGVVLKKSTEIKEMWASLFQLDASVLRHVVIARQKEISAIFTADRADREKVFQKLFLVPSTDKLRKIIYDNYLKTAPPLYMVTPVETLQQEFEESLRRKLELETVLQKNFSSDSLEGRIHYIGNRLMALVAMESADSRRAELSKKLAELLETKAQLSARLETAKTASEQFSMDQLQQTVQQQIVAREQHLAYQTAKDSFDRLEKLKKEKAQRFQDLGGATKIKEVQAEKAELDARYAAASTELEKKKSELASFSKLIAEGGEVLAVCPTCNQKIENLAKHICLVQNTVAQLSKEAADLSQRLSSVSSELTLLSSAEKESESAEAVFRAAQVPIPGTVVFDPALLETTQKVIEKLKGLQNEVISLSRDLQEILKQENDLSLALQRVTGYDGPTSIAQERAELEQERIKLAAALEEKKAIEFKLSSEAANLAYLQKKIEETIKATEANKKTKEYTSILSTVYEGLHPSVFARQLIGMYAGAVQDKLNEYLCMFDFPYSVLIDEGFNLSAYNREGKLPFLSGGQQVVVGLSLRFALHDLFSQSMPLIMIDEGSMSLHESNVQAYFELLRKVKSSMKFKQIIIIDHHAGLADVVDTPIVL